MKEEDGGQFEVGISSFANQFTYVLPKIARHEGLDLSLKDWWICRGVYDKFDWDTIFQHMRSSNAVEIYLTANNVDRIIHTLTHINFKKLKILSIDQNNIVSAERLSLLNCLQLQELYIRNNNITELRGIRHTFWRNLKELWIDGNLIREIPFIFDLISSTELQTLNFQFFDVNKVVCEDLSILAKVFPEKINNLNIKIDGRMKQTRIKAMLTCKQISIRQND